MASSTKFKKTYQLVNNGLKTAFGQSYNSLARIFAYSKVYMHLIIVGNIALILASGVGILLPGYVGKVQDAMKSENSAEILKSIIVELGCVLFATVVFGLIKDFAFDLLSIKVVQDMRKDLFSSLLNKDIEFYDLNKSGDLISRLTGDIEHVQNSSTSDIANLVRRVFELFGSLILLISISPRLTIILFVFIPIKVLMLVMTGKASKKRAKQARKTIAEGNAVANEAFQNIRVVKAFSTEDKEFGLYVAQLANTSTLQVNTLYTGMLVSFIRMSLGFAGLLFMIYMGGSMVITGEITAGNLTTFILCGLNASSAFNSIDRIIKRVASSLGACDRIFDILDYEPRIKANCDKGTTKENLQGDVTLENLSFAYPTKNDVTVLKQMSVKINKGETIALVGASGSGKSTFTNLVQRFYDATKGKVLIDDEDIKEYNLKWLHQHIGYVPQEPSLFSGTIEENIAYGITNYTKEDLEYAIKLANASFVYDKRQFPLGLETKVGERGTKLSGGQKQRIAIARAVIKNPKILIFDEATSALDAESEHQVQQAIDALMQEGGKTLIIIAHRLSTIINCKRILVFEHGEIVEEGSHKSLLKSEGVYKNLVERQLAGFEQ